MTDNNSNGPAVPISVVKLFIDNINESTKVLSKNIEKTTEEVEKVRLKVNTPPRNEELCKQIIELDTKTSAISESITSLNENVGKMITTVKVATLVLTVSILLSALVSNLVVHFNEKSNDEFLSRIEKVLEAGSIEVNE